MADANTTIETMIGVSAESREEVDELCEKAFAAGASRAADKQDHGFMYGWSFNDLDGHVWEVMWMDQSGVPA